MLSPKSDAVYHVALANTPDAERKFFVRCIGFDCVDLGKIKSYYLEDELPDWLKEKISMLMGLSIGDEVKRVGKHVSEGVFWVYKEDED